MIHLLVLREHLKNIYQKYSRFLDSLFRFAAGLLTFLAANEVIGYNPALNHWYIVLILAVFGIVMPGGALVVAAAVFVVAHIFYVSPVLALVVGTVFVILYYVYIKFVPEHAYIYSLSVSYGICDTDIFRTDHGTDRRCADYMQCEHVLSVTDCCNRCQYVNRYEY